MTRDTERDEVVRDFLMLQMRAAKIRSDVRSWIDNEDRVRDEATDTYAAHADPTLTAAGGGLDSYREAHAAAYLLEQALYRIGGEASSLAAHYSGHPVDLPTATR